MTPSQVERTTHVLKMLFNKSYYGITEPVRYLEIVAFTNRPNRPERYFARWTTSLSEAKHFSTVEELEAVARMMYKDMDNSLHHAESRGICMDMSGALIKGQMSRMDCVTLVVECACNIEVANEPTNA